MKKFLSLLIAGESLDYAQALEAITLIGTGEANASQTAAFLMGVQQKGISVDELAGFRQGMLNLAMDLGFDDLKTMDVCGTGGDGKDTFNISTTSAFVAAGADVLITKHGNHGVSSAVGSSTVLEYLGIQFTNDKDFLRQKIETAGICYLHAPLFHPAMKAVAPIRKDLGVKTFFNILGPLMNPAKVKAQLTGVSDLKTFDLYKDLFSKQNGNYAVVHALDGYDEISLTGEFRVNYKTEDKIIYPQDLGFQPLQAHELGGGNTLKDSADILINILKGEGTAAQNAAVIANAGLAISVFKDISLADGVAEAEESLKAKKGYQRFLKLIEK